MDGFKSFITLLEATADELYQNFYSDIEKETFDKLWKADPTSKENVFGDYSKWLLKQYKKLSSPEQKRLTREDLYKVTEILTKYNNLKKSKKITKTDINFFKTLPDLYNFVDKQSDQDIKTQREIKKEIKSGARKVFENSDWLIVIPDTHEAACYYGSGTKWCTASSGAEDTFKYYHDQGPLYIVISKKEKDSQGRPVKYQLHFQSNQYMDSEDLPLRYKEPIYGKTIPTFDANDIETWISVTLGSDVAKFFKKSAKLDQRNTMSFYIHDNKLSGDVYTGNIDLTNVNLKSLDGSPKIINGDLEIVNTGSYDRIVPSLEGGPEEVKGTFFLEGFRLKTLYGSPKIVNKFFLIRMYGLRSLEFCPETVLSKITFRELPDLVDLSYFPKNAKNVDFNLTDCHHIQNLNGISGGMSKISVIACSDFKSLDGLSSKKLHNLLVTGCPKFSDLSGAEGVIQMIKIRNCGLASLNGCPPKLLGEINCGENRLTSLVGSPRIIGGFATFSHNDITSLDGAPERIDGSFNISHNPIKSLEGFPEQIGGDVVIDRSVLSSLNLTADDLRKISKIGGRVYEV